MAWTAVAGAATASLGGALLNSGTTSGSTDTNSKSPWAPVQPWLQNQINTGQNLQDYYQSHPLNSMQQQGYQNLAGNLDNWNSSTAPALQAVANRLMGANYSRTIGQQNYSQPSVGGYSQTLGNPLGSSSPSYAQAMGSNPTASYDQGFQSQQPSSGLLGFTQSQGYPMQLQSQQQTFGGLLGPSVQQQFNQPQMNVTQGQSPYGLLDFQTVMPNVTKINQDAQDAANAKKPKTNDTTNTNAAGSVGSPYSGGN